MDFYANCSFVPIIQTGSLCLIVSNDVTKSLGTLKTCLNVKNENIWHFVFRKDMKNWYILVSKYESPLIPFGKIVDALLFKSATYQFTNACTGWG